MYDKILSRYKDELEDVLTYLDMANNAENATQKGILKDIAWEEREHATMLKHILEKHGKYSADDSIRKLEEDVDKNFRPKT